MRVRVCVYKKDLPSSLLQYSYYYKRQGEIALMSSSEIEFYLSVCVCVFPYSTYILTYIQHFALRHFAGTIVFCFFFLFCALSAIINATNCCKGRHSHPGGEML